MKPLVSTIKMAVELQSSRLLWRFTCLCAWKNRCVPLLPDFTVSSTKVHEVELYCVSFLRMTWSLGLLVTSSEHCGQKRATNNLYPLLLFPKRWEGDRRCSLSIPWTQELASSRWSRHLVWAAQYHSSTETKSFLVTVEYWTLARDNPVHRLWRCACLLTNDNESRTFDWPMYFPADLAWDILCAVTCCKSDSDLKLLRGNCDVPCHRSGTGLFPKLSCSTCCADFKMTLPLFVQLQLNRLSEQLLDIMEEEQGVQVTDRQLPYSFVCIFVQNWSSKSTMSECVSSVCFGCNQRIPERWAWTVVTLAIVSRGTHHRQWTLDLTRLTRPAWIVFFFMSQGLTPGSEHFAYKNSIVALCVQVWLIVCDCVKPNIWQLQRVSVGVKQGLRNVCEHFIMFLEYYLAQLHVVLQTSWTSCNWIEKSSWTGIAFRLQCSICVHQWNLLQLFLNYVAFEVGGLLCDTFVVVTIRKRWVPSSSLLEQDCETLFEKLKIHPL